MNSPTKFDDRPEPAKRLEKARRARHFDSAAAAARHFGWAYPTYFQHESGERGLARMAAQYAKAFKVSEAWLLTGEGEPPPLPRVPILGVAAGRVTGQNTLRSAPLGAVARPPGLEDVDGAYAVYVEGVSMEPAFRESALVFVHPHMPPRPGDHVIVQQRTGNGEPALVIKELVSRQGDVVARQYNPPLQITFPARTVLAVHKVLTMRELFSA